MRKVIFYVVCFCMAFCLFGGERVRIKLADGKTKFAEYDGTVVLDRNGRVISNTLGGSNYKWEYDENGKILTDPEFFATYNSSGKMISFTDRKTNETFRYEYDGKNRLVSVWEDKSAKIESYKYNENDVIVYKCYINPYTGDSREYYYNDNGDVYKRNKYKL